MTGEQVEAHTKLMGEAKRLRDESRLLRQLAHERRAQMAQERADMRAAVERSITVRRRLDAPIPSSEGEASEPEERAVQF